MRVGLEELAAERAQAGPAPALHVDERRSERVRAGPKEAPGVAVGEAGRARGLAQRRGAGEGSQQAEQGFAVARRQPLAPHPTRVQFDFRTYMHTHAYSIAVDRSNTVILQENVCKLK